jgi:DNA-binding XRE family transcriptional regulator
MEPAMPTEPRAGHRVSPKDLSPELRAKYEESKARAKVDLETGVLGPPWDVDMTGTAPFLTELRACVAELKSAREAAGLTLEQVAKRTGLAAETLCRLETGAVTNPTWQTLGRYAAAVGRKLKLTAEK